MEVVAMLVELRTNSQITLPKDIVTLLGLTEGDKLEVYEKDGVICMVPVTVYPKKYVDQLQCEIRQLKDNTHAGKQPVFDSINALMEKLENKQSDTEEHG